MDIVKLGKLLDDKEVGRNAIHIALVPVIAREKLYPGQDIAVDRKSMMAFCTTFPKTWVGIVDPFLKVAVYPGQRFMLCLYPNTVTSLRHAWTHPAFDGEDADENNADSIVKAEKWLKDFAPQFEMSYDELMQAAEEFLVSDGTTFITEYDTENWRDTFVESCTEFWNNYEIVTGKKVAENKRGIFFSCSC